MSKLDVVRQVNELSGYLEGFVSVAESAGAEINTDDIRGIKERVDQLKASIEACFVKKKGANQCPPK